MQVNILLIPHSRCSQEEPLRQLFKGMQSLMKPLQAGGGEWRWDEGVGKALKCSLLVCYRAEVSGGPSQADIRHQCRGQRLIKQRGTSAPALLTNLSPAKTTAGEA